MILFVFISSAFTILTVSILFLGGNIIFSTLLYLILLSVICFIYLVYYRKNSARHYSSEELDQIVIDLDSIDPSISCGDSDSSDSQK